MSLRLVNTRCASGTPLLNESGAQLEQRINIVDNQSGTLSFRLTRPLRAPTHNHGADKKWEDY